MKNKSASKTAVQPKNAPGFGFWQSLSTDQIIIGSIIIITILILGGMAALSLRNNQRYNVNIPGLAVFTDLTAGHQEGIVTYEQTPPVGGPHNAAWQTCGVYDGQIANEHAVHSLEHGAVWITYQPDLAQAEVDKLADITRRGTHRLLSPYPGIDSPIVISAWGYQLKLDSADDQRLMDFIQHYEQGPNTPEPGASCSGGQTRTLAQLGRS